MSKQSDNQPKVVDTIFGDDAGFLSGLGIDVGPSQHKREESLQQQEKPSESTPDKKEISQEKEHDQNNIVQFEPSMKEARVIRKAAPEKKETSSDASSNDVDELIKKKSKEAAYDKEFGGGGRKPQAQKRGGSRTRGVKFSKGRTQPEQDKKITIGATQRKDSRKGTEKATSRKEKTYKVSDSLKKKTTIQIGDTIVVKEFSEKMGVPLPEVMKVLLSNKILVAAQANIDFDTATLIASEFDVKVEREQQEVSVEDILAGDLQAILDQDKEAQDLRARPPIVTVMGHVDHGKTKLLDYLRKTDVVGGEAGGITQSIGASQITHNDQKITFIDTPGHELFSALRARGSKITNIVVIVVAADDGVKPQTIEAIRHAQDAEVPIIVAVTKIDLGVQKLEDIKGQLAQQGLQPEDRGGDIMIIPVSAMTGQGVDDLLDAVLLQYEMLELQYSPSRNAVGVVVESEKDAKQGVKTSLLIMTGTLRIGDIIVVHNTSGKVKKMLDRTGKPITEATGGDPVMILGINELPEPGRVAEVVNTEKEASKKINAIQEHEESLSKGTVLQSLMDKIGKGDLVQLKLILKADSFGSLEAIKHASHQVDLPDNVELKIIHADVGSITNSDVVFAQASEAILIGFNVTASGNLKKKAESMHVTIKEYDIIYNFIEYLEKVGAGMIEVEMEEVVVGKMEILAVFFKKGKDVIFGGKVTQGKAVNGAKLRVWRDDAEEVDEEGNALPVAKGTVTSVQKEQESVKEVSEGHECGIKAKISKKILPGDRVEFVLMQEKAS